MIATLAMIACFALSAACWVVLLFQAVARNVTVTQHLRDAFAAAIRGKSPPRAPWPPPKPDYERMRELEEELL